MRSLAAALLLLLLAATPAWALDAGALFDQARRAEVEQRYEVALGTYERIVAEDRWGPRGPAAQLRLSWLDARRDGDGGFDDLRELQRVRRELGRQRAAEGRQALSALRERGLAGALRVDVALWLGREALGRGDAAGALAEVEAVADVQEPALALQVVDLRTKALSALGRYDEARALEQAHRVPEGGARGRSVAAQRQQDERFARIVDGGLVGLALFALVAARPALRGLRRRRGLRPWGLALLALAAGGAAGIAEGWGDHLGAFGWPLLGAFAAVHGLALLALLGASSGRHRALLRVLAGLATAGVALWVLDRHHLLPWIFG